MKLLNRLNLVHLWCFMGYLRLFVPSPAYMDRWNLLVSLNQTYYSGFSELAPYHLDFENFLIPWVTNFIATSSLDFLNCYEMSFSISLLIKFKNAFWVAEYYLGGLQNESCHYNQSRLLTSIPFWSGYFSMTEKE